MYLPSGDCCNFPSSCNPLFSLVTSYHLFCKLFGFLRPIRLDYSLRDRKPCHPSYRCSYVDWFYSSIARSVKVSPLQINRYSSVLLGVLSVIIGSFYPIMSLHILLNKKRFLNGYNLVCKPVCMLVLCRI